MEQKQSIYFAGLDIGGSTIKAVLVDETAGQVGEIIEVPSRVTEGYETCFKQLEDALRLLTEGANVSQDAINGVGLDVPGPSSDGVIWGQANLSKDWVGVNIRDAFSKHIGLPAVMVNDCNAAAVGEYAVRRKQVGGLLYLAPGTGLGGGLVLSGGKLYEGYNCLAIEPGHMSVPFRDEDGELPDCTCGLKGCLETWVSLIALRRCLKIELAKTKWAAHSLNSDDSTIENKAFRLRDLAEENDPLAVQIFKQQGVILGYAISDLLRLFDPGLVVIGGGLTETSFRDKYMEWVMEGFEEHCWPMHKKSPIDPQKTTTKIEWAQGGDSAGALGMAFTAHDLFG